MEQQVKKKELKAKYRRQKLRIAGLGEGQIQIDGTPLAGAHRNGKGNPDLTAGKKPFPTQCLPSPAAEMACEICRLERVPQSLAGSCALGILSASVGAGVQVKSGPNRMTRGNVFILASADSGTGKSETFRHIAKPFLDFQRERVESWQKNELHAHQADKDLLDSEIAHLKRTNLEGPVQREEVRKRLQEKKSELQKVESALRPPVLSVEDATTEKLAVIFSQNGECLASLSSDAGNVVNNLLGRYSKGGRPDESVYLKSYSGDPCLVHRIGREPVSLNSPCLAALWLVQPDKIEALLRQPSLIDGGLMPRLLMCHTNCQPQPIIDGIQPIPNDVIVAYGQLIRDLLKNCRLAQTLITITPTEEARKALNDHHNGIAERRKADLQDVAIFAARWTEQAWRISVVLHAALWPQDAGAHELDLDTAQRAIAIADWFAEQQLGILAAGREAAQRAVLKEILSLLEDNPNGVTARDVQRQRIAKDADEARQLLERLENEGHLTGRDSKPEGGGHVSRIYVEAEK